MQKTVITELEQKKGIPVLIVGAGINGAGLFRELALQGVDVLLVDKSDFMSGASAAPSRMIHGGLRYLENREVRLVKESLVERNLLLQNAPHYIRPLPTVIPIYYWFSGIVNGIRKFLRLKASNTPRGAIIVKLGLLMYDIFTRKQRVMPRHQFFSRQQSLSSRPLLDPRIVCTALFYDAWISYPERLGIELIQDAQAAHPGAVALNYVALQGQEGSDVLLKDEISGEIFRLRPQVLVNATGAWIDLANAALNIPTRFIGGTKGSHLMIDHPALMAATRGQMIYYENDEGRICILFPLHGKVMVGSTDIQIKDPDEAVCTEEEVEYMMDCVRQVFPQIDIKPSQIVFRYSGVRPLANSKGDLKNAQISRDHSTQIIKPTEQRPFPIFNLIGGKWTTFRSFAQQTCDQVLPYLNQSRRVDSHHLPIGGGKNYPKTEAQKQTWISTLSENTGLDPSRIENLLFRYGTQAEKIAEYLVQSTDHPLQHHPTYSRREVEYLLKNEAVKHLDDLILRRTVIALAGELSGDLLHELAEIQAEIFQYSPAEKEAEIARVIHILEQKHGVELPINTHQNAQ